MEILNVIIFVERVLNRSDGPCTASQAPVARKMLINQQSAFLARIGRLFEHVALRR